MRARAPTIEAPQPELVTIEQIERALTELDAERDATLKALAELPTRERELIEADASESELAALDATKRRLERTLTRAEVIQHRLLARAGEIQAANREVEWSRLKSAYAQAAAEFIATQKEAVRRRERVEAICRETERVGFALRGLSTLPIPPVLFDPSLLHGYERAVRDVGERPPPAPQPPLYSVAVRFTRAWDRYVANDVAGFDSARAQKLIEMGYAQAISTKRAPLSLIGG